MAWDSGHRFYRRRLLCAAMTLGVMLGQAGYWSYRHIAIQETKSTQTVSLPLAGEDSSMAVTVSTPEELQRALNAASHGTVVVLGKSMTLSQPLELNKQSAAIKLQAAGGTVTITAKASRHFRCSGSNVDLVFSGVVLDGGGAAGGIHSTANGLSIAGATIRNCVSAGSGGAVEATAGSLFIEEGTVLENNRALAYGGGVFTGQGVALQIDGGRICDNEAGAYGGGVFGGVGSNVRMDGGSVTGNKAILGGGIYAGLANTIRLNGGEITSNQADGGGSDGGKGGGVYAVTCDIAINGASITDNRATHGGGIYATGDGSDVVLHRGSVKGNEAVGADAYGGGIYLDTAYSAQNTLTVNGGEICSNQGVRGGGVYAGGTAPAGGSTNPGSSVAARITVNSGELRGNQGGLGGALYGDTGSKIHLADGQVRENHASEGGAVWIEPLEHLTVERPVYFAGNLAETLVRQPSQEHMTLHEKNIKATYFSGGVTHGYNNYDIVYTGGEAAQELHTVRFDAGEASSQPSEYQILHGEPIGPLPDVSRGGYTLEGWYTAPKGGERVTAETQVTRSSTLYARWKANTYRLHFDYNGAQPPSEEFLEKEVTYGLPVGFLPIPAGSTEYAFAGWFDGEGKHYFPATLYRVEGDLTLTAKQAALEQAQHRVVFHYGEADRGTDEAERTVSEAEPVGELPLPERDGFVFGGWYSGEDSGPWREVDPVYDELHLYARWQTPPHEVRFHYMGGEELEQTRAVEEGQPIGQLPEPYMPNLEWRGWYADADLTQRVTEDTLVTGDMDLYALWEGQVLFDYQSPSERSAFPDNKSVGYGYRIGALPLPVQPGYFFNGWYSEPEGAGRYYGGGTSAKVYQQTEELPLFASWQADAYTITFDYQGGGPEDPAKKQVVFGDNVGALPFPTREGYRFGGWFTRTDGAGEQYFVSTPYQVSDSITLYANWKSESGYEGEAAGASGRTRPSGTPRDTRQPSAGYQVEILDNQNPMTGR